MVGNGFDLSCGLDSRYSDFFKQRFIDLFGEQKNHNQIRLKLNSGQSTDSWSGKKIDYFKANKCNWPKGNNKMGLYFLIC